MGAESSASCRLSQLRRTKRPEWARTTITKAASQTLGSALVSSAGDGVLAIANLIGNGLRLHAFHWEDIPEFKVRRVETSALPGGCHPSREVLPASYWSSAFRREGRSSCPTRVCSPVRRSFTATWGHSSPKISATREPICSAIWNCFGIFADANG